MPENQPYREVVRNSVNKFKWIGSVKDEDPSYRPSITPDVVQRVKGAVTVSPKSSIRTETQPGARLSSFYCFESSSLFKQSRRRSLFW